jgi:hypothetical protein
VTGLSGRVSWRRLVPVLAALGALTVAVAMPAPVPSPPPEVPAAAGPARLADAWPSATVTTFPGEMPGGYTFRPLLMVSGTLALGVATGPDFSTSQLVLRSTEDRIRVLRTYLGRDRPAVVGEAVAGRDLFWLETGAGPDGQRETVLWRAPVDDGDAVALARDASDVLYYDTTYDLQIVDGTVVWASAGVATGTGQSGEIRTVPVGGGPVSVRSLDRLYALTAWPWVTTPTSTAHASAELLNLTTGERRVAPAGPNEILSCSPAWCRVTTLLNRGQTITVDMQHFDGTARRRVGGPTLMPINSDVALVDRFEVLGSVGPAAATSQQLWLHDLTTERLVLVAEAPSPTIGSRGTFLWWSTGDSEATTWHVVDLIDLR